MKEFHIISTGVSILTNYQKAGFKKDLTIKDEASWQKIIDNPQELRHLYEFLKQSPKGNSAELNTFLRVVEGKNPENIEVYLFGTKTAANELCRRVLENYLKDFGFKIYNPYEVSGYFWEATFDDKYALQEFQKGISELLDRLLYIAKKKKEEGYRVYFNPTGGFKAHVITAAVAGFLTGAEIYYMNEEFNDVVFLPPLLYLPKGKEVELLNKLKAGPVISDDVVNSYEKEIERLKVYGLITLDVEKDEIRLTERGRFFFEVFSI